MSTNRSRQSDGGNPKLPVTLGIARVDATGFLNIPGSVENRTGEWVRYITVHFKLYDKRGKELTVRTTLGESDKGSTTKNTIVAPGGTGYFHHLRDTGEIEGEYDHFEMTVEAFATDARVVLEATDVVVGDLSADPISVSGKIKNVGRENCTSPFAIIITYSGGKIRSVEDVILKEDPSALMPNESADFEALMMTDEVKIDAVKVIGGNFEL
ncbi:MAG: hypothetical protein JXA21_17270 [Anaerolineae bacterium]|nr:hypothetical protein [Anaerolineae bacterium]